MILAGRFGGLVMFMTSWYVATILDGVLASLPTVAMFPLGIILAARFGSLEMRTRPICIDCYYFSGVRMIGKFSIEFRLFQ